MGLRKYLGDWALCIGLQVLVVVVGLHSHPFLREFSLNDASIQHPYTREQVPDLLCLTIATLIPGAVMAIRTLVQVNFNLARVSKKQVHLIHTSILGLVFSISISTAITVVLKNWIGRPRPDFLARCAPDPKKLLAGQNTYGVEVCTGDWALVMEGLRSTPSGHSSLSFAALHYIVLWLNAQLDVMGNGSPIWKLVLCTSPDWLAVWVAITRTQDYRHHLADVVAGGLLGIAVCHAVWWKLFKGKEVGYLVAEERIPLYHTVSTV